MTRIADIGAGGEKAAVEGLATDQTRMVDFTRFLSAPTRNGVGRDARKMEEETVWIHRMAIGITNG